MEISNAQPVQTGVQTRSRSLVASTALAWVIALALLLVGLGLRLFDLTDPPLDFHPTRQLRSAIIARGMYYEMLPDADPALRERAINFRFTMGTYEPSILEALVARTYRLIGSEQVWVARVFSALFWIFGGLVLFDLARRMTGTAGGLAALGYYLFLPFAVQASRAFQPDPWMVMWLIFLVYALYRWSEKPSWKWALLAGLFGGLAVMVKIVAAYLVAGAAVAVVLSTLGRRFWRHPQVVAMLGLIALPSFLYYLVGRQGRASDYFTDWTLSLSHLLLQPEFYMRWLSLVQDLMTLGVLLLGLIGMLISKPRNRLLLAGLWLGYLAYGLFLPYQMYTHNYYHLQLVPVLALSLAPVVELLFERLALQSRLWQLPVLGIAVVAVMFPAWVSFADMKAGTYRGEPSHWQEIGAQLPDDGRIIGLTQDYGYRLMYWGWRRVVPWPNKGELKLSILRGNEQEFEAFFADRTQDMSYFLVTAFGQLDEQPNLKRALQERYPVYAQGDNYIIYDLEHPLSPPGP